MNALEKLIMAVSALEETDLQWVGLHREFDVPTPEEYIEGWITSAKRDLAEEVHAGGRTLVSEPEVLRERGGRGHGVRIRVLSMPFLAVIP